MTSSYQKTVQKFAESGEGDRLPCMWCKTLTLRATLAQYGARCSPCYEAYCLEVAHVGEKRSMDTIGQADLRKRLKASRPIGQTMSQSDADVDASLREAAKQATDRKVREYAQRNGLTLEQSRVIHEREPDRRPPTSLPRGRALSGAES